MILLPKYRDIIKPEPIFAVHSQMAGYFKFTVRNSEGRVTRETDWFQNLITNNGLDLIWNSPSFAYGIKELNPYCFVGTGNAAPVITDTTLQAYLASGGQYSNTPNGTLYVVGPPPYWSYTMIYRFGTGVAAGNLSEVGVGWATNNLFSRALIKDGAGNPTTITVLADEVLDVTYQLRVYPPTADITTSMLLNGVSTSLTARTYYIQSPTNIYNPIQQNGANTSLPYPIPTYAGSTLADIYGIGGAWTPYGGNGATPDSTTNPSYVIGSYEINCAAHWPLGGAVGQNQIWSVEWPQGRMMFRIASPATKTNVQQMSLTYRISWGRYP